jgi:hypothetical protein
VLVITAPGPQGPSSDSQQVLDLTGKADKVVGATSGHLASLTSQGNLADSGKDPATLATKVVGGTTGNFASLDASGNIQDSGHKHSDYITSVATKADKAVGAVVGDFASFDGSGNPVDSGHKHADYALAGHSHALLDSATNLATGATLVKRDVSGNANFNNVNANSANATIYSGQDVEVSGHVSAALFQGDGGSITNVQAGNVTGLGTAATKNADNTANNTVLLDGSGLLPTSVLPPLAVNETFVVASQAAMLSLTAQRGDMAIRTDVSKTFVLSTDSPTTLADWKELLSPGSVVSVNGQTGVVVLTTTNIAEGTNLYYTTARVNTDAPNVTLGTANGLSLTGQQLSLGLASGAASGAMSSADYTKLQGIAAGAQPGTVTSVALTVPSWLGVSGSPVTTTGTLAVTAVNQNANRVLAGPATGGAATPDFRALVPADLPTMVGSGASHAAGIVPDPGSTAGTTKFLREDATWAVPAGGGGGGTPGGADTYVQFNDAGAFGGVANLAYNKTSGLFSVKMVASQTADIFQVLANDGTPVLRFGTNGDQYAKNAFYGVVSLHSNDLNAVTGSREWHIQPDASGLAIVRSGVQNLAYFGKDASKPILKLISYPSQTDDLFQVVANDGTTKIASIGNTGTATFARLVLQHYDQFDGSNLLEFRNQAGSLISSVSYGGTYTINSLSMGSPAAGGQDGYLRINKGQFQGGNQFEVSSDGTTVVAAFNAVFMRSILPASPTVDPDVTTLTAGTMTFWIDETNNLLKFKVKYSNGTTVKSGSVALA